MCFIYSAVRVALYHTLEVWVCVGRGSSSVLQGSSSHTEMLFAHLIGDITPGTEAVKVSHMLLFLHVLHDHIQRDHKFIDKVKKNTLKLEMDFIKRNRMTHSYVYFISL